MKWFDDIALQNVYFVVGAGDNDLSILSNTYNSILSI